MKYPFVCAAGHEAGATKGRSLDHIGFDVKDLDAFAKKLEALGISFDVASRQIPDSKTRVACLTDPWALIVR